MGNNSFVFRFDDVEVREREFTLTKAGKLLAIEPKAFRALLFLLHNPQRLISKEELLNSLWGDVAVSEGSLTRCIWLLRRLLEDDTREPRYIETVATVGYRFVCRVEVSEDGGHGSEPTEIKAADGASQAKPRSYRRWWLIAVPAFVVALGSATWALLRPLPPPRISKFARITHDGHEKDLVGTDGSRLYITPASPVISIAQVGIAGGDIAQIPVPVSLLAGFSDVSTDGSSLLVESVLGSHDDLALWTFRVPGGPLRRLGDKPVDAAFSPNAESVIYSTLSGDVYRVRSDGTGTRKLASLGPDPAEMFAWSADGETIRFDQDDKFWQMSADGSNLHQVIPGWHSLGPVCCGRWTPDGKFFVFQAGDWRTGGSQIWALDERHGFFRRPPTVPIQLTAGPINWSRPIPGKDGRTLFSVGAIVQGELSRFDTQAKEFRPLLGGISAGETTFSKDGRFVAYVSFPGAVLWKADRDGSNPMQLSEPTMDVFMPRWSPDGTQILFSDISSDSEIYIVSAQGGNPRKLLPESSGKQSDPDWSPDGHKIVFGTSFGGHDPKGQIRIFDLESQKITTLPGSVGMTDPRWSPDGRSIAANSSDLNTMNIFDVGKQKWTALPLSFDMTFPEWSRNSQFIYFLHVYSKDPGFYRIRVKGDHLEKIVDLKNWHISGWLQQWAGLDPTDAPLLLRDIGSSDIYSLTLDQ